MAATGAEAANTSVVCVALIDADGRVLLAERPAGKTMAGLWEYPGCTLPPRNSPSPAIGLPAGRSASKTRPSASIKATQTTLVLAASAPVAAIDVDIAVGQVAAPHRPAAAPDAEIDGDLDVAPGHVPRYRRLVGAGHGVALGRNLDAPHRDRQPVAVGFFAGFAHRHDDAAPIGVAGGDRRLDQG